MRPERRQSRRPPRLVVRTLVATFGAIAAVLGATFLTLIVETRARVAGEVAVNLDVSQHAFADLERQRQGEAHLQAAAFAESATLSSRSHWLRRFRPQY
jgi:hypothetical protein